MTKQQAYNKGVYAAHERITPVCPFNSIYESEYYNAWYDGLVYEKRALKGKS